MKKLLVLVVVLCFFFSVKPCNADAFDAVNQVLAQRDVNYNNNLGRITRAFQHQVTINEMIVSELKRLEGEHNQTASQVEQLQKVDPKDSQIVSFNTNDGKALVPKSSILYMKTESLHDNSKKCRIKIFLMGYDYLHPNNVLGGEEKFTNQEEAEKAMEKLAKEWGLK